MSLGYDRRLYILAFDHRGSFQKKMFGITGTPDPAETAKISDAKTLIFEGFRQALADGVSPDVAGVLVDEQFGSGVARSAKSEGLVLAMPVEKSGQDEFDFDYGDAFGAHIEDFDPAFVKVLVRYNPEGDGEMNRRQIERLARLSAWLHERGRRFLFELLVPAESAQLASVGGDEARYDAEVRPDLMVRTVAALQAAGVEPDVWKIEGVDTAADCGRIAAQTRSGAGRSGVGCVVLGRGADDAKVDQWLRAGAGVPGYLGFAIGRSIWWDHLKGWLDGSVDRGAAAKGIAANYRRFIDVYEGAAGSGP
ncbi:MAG: 2-deoxy-5-keto-D-gluconate 6-phosphate aldolase domain-containing protein [Acidimicrobiales bacterium]